MTTDQNTSKNENKEGADYSLSMSEAFGFAWEMGYTMTIPLVALALGGRLLDRYLDTTPIFLLIGIFVSIVVSSILLGMKATQIINRTCSLKGQTEQDQDSKSEK